MDRVKLDAPRSGEDLDRDLRSWSNETYTNHLSRKFTLGDCDGLSRCLWEKNFMDHDHETQFLGVLPWV